MSQSIKIRKPTIKKILKEDFCIKRAIPLKKLLGLNSSPTIKMRKFKEQKDSFFKKDKDIENFIKKNDRTINNEYKTENLKELNDSIIKLFHKVNYLQNRNKKNFEQKKVINGIFSKRFNNMKKFEKEKEKFDKKENNSDVKFNQSFEIFNDLVNKYKERDGILYKKDLFKKDIFKETPIVTKDQDNIKNFYLCHFDKYANKTNLNNTEIINPEKNSKKNKKPNEMKRINFDTLSVTNYYKKLFFISQEKIEQMKEKNFVRIKNRYHSKYDRDKEKVKNEIPKLQKDIINLKSIFKSMEEVKNKNINYSLSDRYKTPSKTGKKILINIDIEQMLDSSKEFQPTKKETNVPNKKYQIDTFSNIKLLSPISIENSDNKKRTKKLFIRKSFSNISQRLFNRNKYKKVNTTTSQKIKPTFYSIKNKTDKISPLTPRNEIKNSIDINNEELKDAKDAYEELKLISLDNKYLILDKIEQYLLSKGYNVERIKNSLGKEQLYNFFDNIKNTVMSYKCKPNVNKLYSHIGKSFSENLRFNLKKIKKMDKEISATENYYYLSLING